MPEHPTGNMEIEEHEQAENEPRHSYHLRVMRHAQRQPSGELRPEGVEKARKFGETLSDSVVVKPYASTEKTGRTVKTANFVVEGSGVKSPAKRISIESGTSKFSGGAEFNTRQVEDIEYNMIEPELLNTVRSHIDQLTLDEIARTGLWSIEGLDIRNLPAEMPEPTKIKIGEIRQDMQEAGFEMLMDDAGSIHNMAMGLAHQFVHKMEICRRLQKFHEIRTERGEDETEGDVDINITTHGMFSESMFLSAGLVKTDSGFERIENFDNLGGIFLPNESWYLDIPDPSNVPELIPVVFEGENRPAKDVVFVERSRLEALDRDYEEWKRAQVERSERRGKK